MAEPRIQTVSNVFAMLELLAVTEEPVAAKQIAVSLGLSVNVVHRLLAALSSDDIVLLDPARKTYALGPEFLRLAAVSLRRSAFLRVSRAVMKELVRRADETTCLNLYRPAESLFSVQIVEESAKELQYVLETGTQFPLHAGAGGKAILANLPPDVVETILTRKPLAKVTDNTVTTASKLRSQLADIGTQGYAITYGERLEGAVGIAVPVYDERDMAVASLQFTIPLHRFDKARVPELVALLREYSQKLTGLVQVAG